MAEITHNIVRINGVTYPVETRRAYDVADMFGRARDAILSDDIDGVRLTALASAAYDRITPCYVLVDGGDLWFWPREDYTRGQQKNMEGTDGHNE